MQTLGALGSLAELQSGGQTLDLTSVSTDYPVLVAGLYNFKVTGSKAEPVKDNPNNTKWVLELQAQSRVGSQEPMQSTKGKEIPVGHKITMNIGLSQTEKYDSSQILANVCRVLDAVYGEAARGSINLNDFDLSSIIGADVIAKATVQPEKDQWPEKNDIKLVKKAA